MESHCEELDKANESIKLLMIEINELREQVSNMSSEIELLQFDNAELKELNSQICSMAEEEELEMIQKHISEIKNNPFISIGKKKKLKCRMSELMVLECLKCKKIIFGHGNKLIQECDCC